MTFNDLQAAVTISHTPHTHIVLFHRPQKWGVEKWPFPLRTNDTWGLTKTLPVNTGWALGGRSPLLIRAAQLAQNVCMHLLERLLIMQLHSYSGVWTLDLWKKQSEIFLIIFTNRVFPTLQNYGWNLAFVRPGAGVLWVGGLYDVLGNSWAMKKSAVSGLSKVHMTWRQM